MSDPFPPPSPLPPEYGGLPSPPTSNGVAVGAMVLGILAVLTVLTFIFSVVAFIPGTSALILGIVGLRRSRLHPTRLGRAPAITGIVLGGLSTLASVAAIAIVALFVASSDVAVIDTEVAAPDDFSLSDRTCEVDGALAVATGVLTNESGTSQGFVITVRFFDGSLELGSASDELDAELADGQTWAWEVARSVDPERVNTDGLDCRVDRVEVGRVVSD